MKFALNHMTAPRICARQLIGLAASLGCVGVELRNDLAAKGLSDASFFNGETPEEINVFAKDHNIAILGLSEVYGFNEWSDDIADQIKRLVDQAVRCGAPTVNLIPMNEGLQDEAPKRMDKLTSALANTVPLIEGSGVQALIEPLGFATSSLYLKSEAVAAINAVDGGDHFKLVHDTFHHFLGEEQKLFPAQTGLVHISGVVDAALTDEMMRDEHRVLVDAHDRLGNIAQIRALLDGGYEGAFSFEAFSPAVHGLDDAEAALSESMDFIRGAVAA